MVRKEVVTKKTRKIQGEYREEKKLEAKKTVNLWG